MSFKGSKSSVPTDSQGIWLEKQGLYLHNSLQFKLWFLISMNYNSAHKHYFIHVAAGKARAICFVQTQSQHMTSIQHNRGRQTPEQKVEIFFGQWLALGEKGSFWEKFPKPRVFLLHLYPKWSNVKEIHF